MLPVFSSCCKELVARWIICSSEGWCEVDAGDAISRTAFGSSYDIEGRRIAELDSEQADCISASVKTMFIPGYL
jgi:hypothetical protein